MSVLTARVRRPFVCEAGNAAAQKNDGHHAEGDSFRRGVRALTIVAASENQGANIARASGRGTWPAGRGATERVARTSAIRVVSCPPRRGSVGDCSFFDPHSDVQQVLRSHLIVFATPSDQSYNFETFLPGWLVRLAMLFLAMMQLGYERGTRAASCPSGMWPNSRT